MSRERYHEVPLIKASIEVSAPATLERKTLASFFNTLMQSVVVALLLSFECLLLTCFLNFNRRPMISL